MHSIKSNQNNHSIHPHSQPVNFSSSHSWTPTSPSTSSLKKTTSYSHNSLTTTHQSSPTKINKTLVLNSYNNSTTAYISHTSHYMKSIWTRVDNKILSGNCNKVIESHQPYGKNTKLSLINIHSEHPVKG